MNEIRPADLRIGICEKCQRYSDYLVRYLDKPNTLLLCHTCRGDTETDQGSKNRDVLTELWHKERSKRWLYNVLTYGDEMKQFPFLSKLNNDEVKQLHALLDIHEKDIQNEAEPHPPNPSK